MAAAAARMVSGRRWCWLYVLLSSPLLANAWTSNQPVSTLLQEHAARIAKLKSIVTEEMGSIAAEPFSNDVFYLRYCLEYDDAAAAEVVLQHNLAWRQSGKGQALCTAALEAVTAAKAGGDAAWNNEPVLSAAPHSAKITQFLTPDNCITTTTSQNDLVYCIRAGYIDDVALMDAVSIAELTDFFLYAKEVNFLVSLQRSLENDKQCSVITANDLSGVKLLGGSADFRKALSASSKESDALYPATNGPTLLLNLPAVVSALVKLFTPLFPESVKARLRFEQGPLRDVQSLTQIVQPNSAERQAFLAAMDKLVY